ncbi:MAG: MFS transporter [Sphaerochaeta sp.]|uniref:MFS transporter n=1 Tax=Sphaerochaeta sp. TaxID=1972642 RepID=UPI003D0F0222
MTHLTKRTKFGFGIGDLGGNLFFTIMGFYLLYYFTDVVGLLPALAGTALMIGKVWDAITDPITGYVSDRTHSKWGRRRPYMFVGAIISFFCMTLIFTPIHLSTQLLLFIYVTFVYCLLNTAYTLVNIPYAALLPELTEDYHQRTILTGYRMSFAVVGTFIGAALVMPIISLFSSQTMGWSMMGTFMGSVMLFSTLATVYAIKEPEHHAFVVQNGFFSTFSEVLKDKVFLSALLPWTFFITGTSMVQGALVYYFAYIFGNEGLFQLALVALLSFSLLFIPLWVRIAGRIGKKRCYMIGMSIMAVAVLLFSLLGAKLGPIYGVVVMGLAGIGLSTHYVMPHAILPDIVEYDAIKQKRGRREGVFSSLWTFSSKLGQAFALALNGWILALFGYQSSSVGPLAKIGIILLCGPLPLLWYIVGLWILRHYPIDKAYYEKLLDERVSV